MMDTKNFYDFPFHPIILERSGYVKYCNISEQRTRCYTDQCGDDVIFFFYFLVL